MRPRRIFSGRLNGAEGAGVALPPRRPRIDRPGGDEPNKNRADSSATSTAPRAGSDHVLNVRGLGDVNRGERDYTANGAAGRVARFAAFLTRSGVAADVVDRDLLDVTGLEIGAVPLVAQAVSPLASLEGSVRGDLGHDGGRDLGEWHGLA